MSTKEMLEAIPRDYLTAADISKVMKCNPANLRAQARTDKSKLGFECSVIGSRVRFSKEDFLTKWFK